LFSIYFYAHAFVLVRNFRLCSERGMQNSISVSRNESSARYPSRSAIELDRDALVGATSNSAMIETALDVAAYHARRLARTMRLSAADREDVQQEILITLLERWRYFDPARGSWRAFANRVARQAVQASADSLGAAHRREAPASADVEDRRPSDCCGSLADSALLQWDLERFVATLPPALAFVARLMVDEEGEAGMALQRSGLSSSEFFRRLDETRRRLWSLGLVRRRIAVRAT
jgi:DNA-directed RNA polymerase specialized sigma24 family protein